ncbi:MAG TPA: hypothetical protein VK081_01965 [Planctomycetota bacterium]|nr:hypothetical protein [Planctomycetota bacterium]
MARLTLHDFYRTGQQDAANVFGQDEVREALREHPSYTDRQILDDILEHTYGVNDPQTKAAWIADQELEGLDPDKAWASYQRGWSDRAMSYIRDWRPAIVRAQLESNPRKAPMSRRNPDDFDDSIKDGMARAIWVSAFADWVQELPKAQRRELAPGAGADWNDAAGETPRSALEAGQALLELYEQANDKPIGDLFRTAAQADGRKPTDRLADLFGHALAMQALGTGVAWTDDHKPFPLKRVQFQAWLDADPDDDRDRWRVDWSPRSMANPAGGGGFTNAQMVAMQDEVHAQNRRGLAHGLTEHLLGALKGARDFADIQERIASLNRRRVITNADAQTLGRMVTHLRRVSAAALTSNPRPRGARGRKGLR